MTTVLPPSQRLFPLPFHPFCISNFSITLVLLLIHQPYIVFMYGTLTKTFKTLAVDTIT